MTAALVPCLLPLACGLASADVARCGAGDPPTAQHIRLVRVAPIDGNPLAESHAGRACLRTDRKGGNPYIYFDVSRQWLKGHGYEPFRVEATIEYLDEGTGHMAVQYDSMGSSVEANFREVTWSGTGSGLWRTITVALDGVEFRNGQQGQADLRVAAPDTGADLRLASIALRVMAASDVPPTTAALTERRPPKPDEVPIAMDSALVQPLSGLTEAERMALDGLRGRLTAIGVAQQGAGGRKRATAIATIVVGRWRSGMAARYPRTAAAIRRLERERSAFRRRDGYVLVVERARPALVCAVSLEAPGAVYAMSDLHVRALRRGDAGVLVLPRTPSVERPALDRRELYLNIGYGLRRPRITVEDWSISDWRRYIDRLILARYNTWSFYLWGDCAMLHPLAASNRALNRRLHATLREAIRYSHRRGMRVGLQFTPTMVPIEIWKANPAIQAKLEYSYPGTVCPSREETWRWMREVQELEISWFAECDFFSLWYYDVGGCFCEVCRNGDRQLAVLLRQAETFALLVRKANPRAVFQVMAWAIWRYERMHGYAIRDRFIASLRRWFAGRRIALEVADGIYVDPGTTPVFDVVRRERLPAKAFLYQTNIETGQPLPIVQTRYMARWVREATRAGATSAFLMRMEAGTKRSDDVVAGCYLWAPDTARGDAILCCARQFTGDSRAAASAWLALSLMDDFAWFGRAGGAADAGRGARIADLCERAAKASPSALRTDLEWLLTAGRAYAVLGKAVDARDDEDEAGIAALDSSFAAVMRQSPLYRAQVGDAPYWRDLFRTALVRYFYSGWSTYHF